MALINHAGYSELLESAVIGVNGGYGVGCAEGRSKCIDITTYLLGLPVGD